MPTSKITPDEISISSKSLSLSRTENFSPSSSNENNFFDSKNKSDASLVKTDEAQAKKIEDQNESLVEKIVEWGSTSSAHGFPGISSKNTNWFIKLVWLVLMLTSWSYCFYTIIKTIIQFYEYEADTKIMIINEIPSKFPQIDICNLSPYKYLPKNNDVNAYPNLNSVYYDDNNMTNTSSESSFSRNNLHAAEIFIKNYLALYGQLLYDNEIDFDNITSNWNEMVQFCKFKNKKCNKIDFDYYQNFYYGRCFSFNRDNTRTISKPGWKYGLRLELSIAQNKLLNLNSGFKILINNQSLYSFPEENGIDISPGFQTNIAISRTFNEKLPYPYNDCLDNLYDSKYEYLIRRSETLQQMKINEYLDYDPNLCFKMCMQKYFIDKCNCSMMELPPYYQDEIMKPCYDNNTSECVDQHDHTFFNSSSVDDCIEACPERCSVFSYDTKISFSKYPSEWYAQDYLNNNQTLIDDYFNNVALVNIYFNEILYTYVYQEPSISVESLFGTIGGQLGLFIGISILSLAENVELALLVFFYYMKKRKQNKANENSKK